MKNFRGQQIEELQEGTQKSQVVANGLNKVLQGSGKLFLHDKLKGIRNKKPKGTESLNLKGIRNKKKGQKARCMTGAEYWDMRIRQEGLWGV